MTLSRLTPSLFEAPNPCAQRPAPARVSLQRAAPAPASAATLTLPIDANALRSVLRSTDGTVEFTLSSETLELVVAYADGQGAHSRRLRGRVRLAFETVQPVPAALRA
jgi:hypothetical protein